MQYNFYKELNKYWTFSFDFLFSIKRLCIQPIHLCIEADKLQVSIGLLFIRASIRVEKWEQ